MWILNALCNLQLLFFGKNLVHYFIINFWHITEYLLCYKTETEDKEMTFSVWILWDCRDASCIVWELSLFLTYLQENVLPWVRCKCLLICNDNRKSVLNYVCTVYLVSWYLPHLELNTVKPSYNDIGLCDISSVASDILWYQLIPHF